MAAFQLKRSARNRLTPLNQTGFLRRLERQAEKLPAPAHPELIDESVLEMISQFYRADATEMDEAAHGVFTLFGRTVDFGSIAAIDWNHRLSEELNHHMWRMKLNQLEIVHSLIASGEPDRQRVALALLETFAGSRIPVSSESFQASWSPYGASHRMIALLSGLALAKRAGNLPDNVMARCESPLRLDAAFVARNIEHDLRNNHTERNLAALCLFHTACGHVSPRRARLLEREVKALIEATVLPDGTQVERSPMYQGLTVMSLRIFAGVPFFSDGLRKRLAATADAAEDAWRFLTHEDGDIALFNDSWLEEAPPLRRLSSRNGAAMVDALPDGGYYRVAGGPVVALLDAGPIGPRWNPGHGHSDFLSVELDVGGERLVVDPGTSDYSSGEIRDYERSSASHNGPRYDGVEPVTYAGSFRVGVLAEARAIAGDQLARVPGRAVGGELSTSAGNLRRIVAALPSGGLVLVDEWSAPSPLGKVRLLFPDNWRLRLDGHVLSADSQRGNHCVIEAQRGTVHTPTSAQWCRRFMRPETASAVELTPGVGPHGSQRLEVGVGMQRPDEAQAVLSAIDTVFASAGSP